MPCDTIRLCALSHHSTPSMFVLLCQSSSGANSVRNGEDMWWDSPHRSWHWSESPVVSVASKSVIKSS